MPFAASSPLPRPGSDVVDVELDGERVLYRAVSDRLARLDRVGSIVWSVLDGQGTVADLAVDVADAFGVELPTATADLIALLDDLEAQGFLEGSEEPESRANQQARPGYLADPPSP